MQSSFEGKLSDGNLLTAEVLAERTFHLRIYEPHTPDSGMNRYGFLRKQAAPAFTMEETEETVTFSTEKGAVCVNKEDGAFVLSDGSGKILVSAAEPPRNGHDGWMLSLTMDKAARLYGLGDVTRERIEKTGFKTEMWVRNVKSYIPIPFMMSSRGWAFYLNTTWRHTVDAGKTDPDRLTLSGEHGGIDLYLFVGEDCEALLNEYTNLLGKPAMLPVWAYGLMYVCNQQVNAREMMQECMNFRAEGIPCDVCGLEPGWMSEYYDFSVDKKWDPDRFYIPKWKQKGNDTFFGALERLGFKLSLWLCCDYDFSFEEERRLGNRGRDILDNTPDDDDFEKDANFRTSHLSMDQITKVEEPWFEHLKKFVDQGAVCFKLDGSRQVVDHPDRKWGNGMDDEEMHNLYPLLYNRQMSDGFQAYTGRRSMIYSSGGYAGIQCFSATWAGDTGGGPKPLVHMLNHGYSGHVNASCDMDVFVKGGIHFGFFQTWSQLNNWAYWRQPWFLQKERKELFRFYANLRYRMLPYIYTLAHRAALTGYPFMRAMSMAFPEMENADSLIYQYMFGDDLLTEAFAENIVLPAGTWYDAWTNKRLEGDRTLPVAFPENTDGPLYVREGAVIPTCHPGEYIGQKPLNTIEWNLYPGDGARAYELYEDDGVSLQYLDGKCALTALRMEKQDGKQIIRIGRREGSYDGMPEKRDYRINLMTVRKASGVSVNGRAVAFELRRESWCGEAEEGFVSFAVPEGESLIVVDL